MDQELVEDHVCDEIFCSHSLHHTSTPAFGNDIKNFDLQLPFSRSLQRRACA